MNFGYMNANEKTMILGTFAFLSFWIFVVGVVGVFSYTECKAHPEWFESKSDGNVLISSGTGLTTKTEAQETLIGYQAGDAAVGSNCIAVGSNALGITTGTENTCIGDAVGSETWALKVVDDVPTWVSTTVVDNVSGF